MVVLSWLSRVGGPARPRLWPILGALGREGASTPSEVARLTGIGPSAVTRQLDRLEKGGLLQRVRSATDRRSVLLELTEKGEALVPKLAAVSRETNERFVRGLTKQELAAFRDTIKKMLRNADGPIEQL